MAKKQKKSILIKVGEVAVDTGQIMILDPCYADPEFFESLPQDLKQRSQKVRGAKKVKKPRLGFVGALQATYQKHGAGQMYFKNGLRAGVACATGWGDGIFPVYLELDAEGHPAKLFIDFQR